MNYELARKLKDSGFPQECENVYEKDTWIHGHCFSGWHVFNKNTDRAEGEQGPDCPTLEELIEACGENFRMLLLHTQFNKKSEKPWEAVPNKKLRPEVKSGKGENPLVAVANIYLALNKK